MNIIRYRYVVLAVISVFLTFYSVATFAKDDEHDHSEVEHGHREEGSHKNHEGHEEDEHEHGHEESSPVEWTKELLKESNIKIKSVSSGEITLGIELPGKIVSYEPNVAHIIPRFPGIIKEARKHLGESVRKGEVLAVIESNQSLNPYEVKSPISGVVVKRHSTVGEYASETTGIFVIADLSKVWGEFYVFSDDFGKIEIGNEVMVQARPLDDPLVSTISFISRVVDEHTQSKFVRTILENPDGRLYPGAFVDALVKLKSIQAPMVVEKSAIQRLEGREVIFIWTGEGFESRPVITGKHDRHLVSILSGLHAEEQYATGNTFLIKAEIGKSEAEHAH